MKKKSYLIFGILVLFSLTFISAEIQVGTSGEIGVDLNIPTPINYTLVNVNNSIYWGGYPWSDTRWLEIDGGNANTNIDIGIYNITANNFFGDGSELTGIVHNELSGLQGGGGEGSEYYHLDLVAHDSAMGFLATSNWYENNLLIGSGINLTFDNGNITATNFFGTFTGNSSIWSRAGTNTFLTNVGDNVGIGTASPNSELHVAGDITFDAGKKVGSHLSYSYLGYASNFAYGELNTHGKFYINIDSNNNTNIDAFIVAKNNVGTSGTELFRVQENGSVGINTTTPQNTLNVVGDANVTGLIYGNGSQLTDVPAETLDGYDSSFFMPLNKSVYGQFDFNGDWQSGGVSIIDGNIFAQKGYFYNISALEVTTLRINGSLLPYEGSEFDNQFDIGSANSRWRDIYLSGEIHSDGTGDSYFMGDLGIGTLTPQNKLNVIGDGNFTGNLYADNVWIPQYSFAHTDATINVASAGVWYNITFDEESLKQGITHTYNDNTNDTFYITQDGVYDLHGHISIQDSATNPISNIVFRFVRNGVEINGSLREKDLDKKDWDALGSTSVFASLTAGDEIKFQFTADQTTVSLESDFTYGEHEDTAVIKIKRIA